MLRPVTRLVIFPGEVAAPNPLNRAMPIACGTMCPEDSVAATTAMGRETGGFHHHNHCRLGALLGTFLLKQLVSLDFHGIFIEIISVYLR